MTNSVSERWLSVDEIADYLGIKRDTVYKWIAGKASDQRATHAETH